MRILQLIDSLRPGGAEKMAVNIANALLPHIERSYVCCTRQEGMLRDEIRPGVGYLFLNKKSRIDPKAILGLRKFINDNKIDIVHAHSTSFFLASILKLSGCNFKLVWHDHYGDSENLEVRDYKVLKNFSRLFAGIISVNTALKEWAIQSLNCNNVIEINNFIPEPDPEATAKIHLKGNKDDFKIICVANLRPQKDHFNLIEAFEMLEPDLNVSLHLVGENPETEYSKSVLIALNNSPVKEKIFYYGTQQEIISILKQADVGVLASRSEGLPLVLLEFGMAGLPVISTRVGKCGKLVKTSGQIVSPGSPEELKNALIYYLENPGIRKKNAASFQRKIEQEYSQESIILKIYEFYKEL